MNGESSVRITDLSYCLVKFIENKCKMELRPRFNKLRELLVCAGVYEEGMELEEMCQVAQAIEMSSTTYNGVECANLDRAILESEIDFQMMVNSTMIVEPPTPTSPIDVFIDAGSFERDCESPPSDPVHMQVQALVHHEVNWSPTNSVNSVKRKFSEDSGNNLKRAAAHNPTERVGEEPFNPDATPNSIASSDSGVSCEEISTLYSISDTSTMPSIGEMPSRLLISTSSAAVSDLSEHDQSEQSSSF